jgi:hypothetical protein
MAQSHNVLPSYGKSQGQTASMTFDTHFQGFITHGYGHTIYRSFGNVGKGGNVAIHAWLSHLEKHYIEHKRLPDTLYYQIDGGPENANDVTVGIASLLVYWGLTKNVYITRLPPGHTHNDIDGIFGVIWRFCWRQNILTPQDQFKYVMMSFASLRRRKAKVEMVDIFAVPDYWNYLKPHVYLKRVFKQMEENNFAMLQIIVNQTDISEQFPLGVKVTLRPYPTNTAMELVKEDNLVYCDGKTRSLTGIRPARCYVQNHPTKEENKGADPGCSVLNTLPNGCPTVADFKEIKIKDNKDPRGYILRPVSQVLNEMVEKMTAEHRSGSAVSKEWLKFQNEFPSTSGEAFVADSVANRNNTYGNRGNDKFLPENKYHLPFATFWGTNPNEEAIRNTVGQSKASFLLSGKLPLLETDSQSCGEHRDGITGRVIKGQRHARRIREHDKNGLISPYLVPSDGYEKLTIPYESMSLVALRELMQKYGLARTGDRNKLIGLLKDRDERIATGAEEPKAAAYAGRQVLDLKSELKRRGVIIPKKGKKEDLIKALVEHDENGGTEVNAEGPKCLPYNRMTIKDLIVELTKRGLIIPKGKKKKDLIDALVEHDEGGLKSVEDVGNDEEDGNDDNNDDVNDDLGCKGPVDDMRDDEGDGNDDNNNDDNSDESGDDAGEDDDDDEVDELGGGFNDFDFDMDVPIINDYYKMEDSENKSADDDDDDDDDDDICDIVTPDNDNLHKFTVLMLEQEKRKKDEKKRREEKALKV